MEKCVEFLHLQEVKTYDIAAKHQRLNSIFDIT